MEEILLKEKPLVLITEKAQQQIDYLHQEVGQTEWSGMICYQLEGSTDKLAEMVIKVTNVLPYNVGTPGYTEFKFGPETIKLEKESGTMKDLKGKIHTHHSMATFFSGTDMADLRDNYEDYAMYLSLIVNFKGPYTAKIAFKGSNIYSEMIVGKKKYRVNHGKKSMFIANCDIQSEGRNYNLDDWFKKQTSEIIKNRSNRGSIKTNTKPSSNSSVGKTHSSTGGWPKTPANSLPATEEANKGSEANMRTRSYTGTQAGTPKGPVTSPSNTQGVIPLDFGLNDVTCKNFAAKLLTMDIGSTAKFAEATQKFHADLEGLDTEEDTNAAFEVFMDVVYENYIDLVLAFFDEEVDIDDITKAVCRKLNSHASKHVRKVGTLLAQFAESLEEVA